MEKFTTLTGVAAPMNMINIDTDMIIPKQYLTTVGRTGLGKALFFEMRYNDDGSENPDFVLNQPAYRNATILVAGDNFGCGSSREHAPWALMGHGFKAVISTSFADIFRNNCLKNGLLPIIVDETTHTELFALAEARDDLELSVDLTRQVLVLPDGREVEFPVDEFSKKCIVEGGDQLSYIQQQMNAIVAYEGASANALNTI